MKSYIHPKPFYFIRHGESIWNTLDQFAGGQTDTPLTDKGIIQAQDARATFDMLSPSPTHIIHSYLSRAKDTACILNINKSLPMIERTDLREVDAGDWAGLSNTEAKARWADGLTPINGENIDMFKNRIQRCFNDILITDNYEIPFIVAHGRIINAIDAIYGIPQRSLQVKNCQILKFIPSKGQYPWDVHICTIKSGRIHEELADWSQI